MASLSFCRAYARIVSNIPYRVLFPAPRPARATCRPDLRADRRSAPRPDPAVAHTDSTASSVHPPVNTERRRNSVRSSSLSRSWLQSTTPPRFAAAASPCANLRSAARTGPASPTAISCGVRNRKRAAASPIAAGSRPAVGRSSRPPQRLNRPAGSSVAPGRHARRTTAPPRLCPARSAGSKRPARATTARASSAPPPRPAAHGSSPERRSRCTPPAASRPAPRSRRADARSCRARSAPDTRPAPHQPNTPPPPRADKAAALRAPRSIDRQHRHARDENHHRSTPRLNTTALAPPAPST